MRLNKLLVKRGMFSRREADRYIGKGWIRVNGETAVIGQKVAENVDIELSVSATAAKERKTRRRQRFAKDLLTWRNQSPNCPYDRRALIPSRLKKLAVAGRLDTQSSGLLVLTQDGVIAKQIVGSTGETEKEYIVTVSRRHRRSNRICSDDSLARLRDFGTMDGKILRPAIVERVRPRFWRPEPRIGLWPERHELHRGSDVEHLEQLRFVLREGRYHQIRRMCDDVGLDVEALVRVRVGNLELGDLQSGFWRQIEGHEIEGNGVSGCA